MLSLHPDGAFESLNRVPDTIATSRKFASEMETRHVDPNTVPVWRWHGLLVALLPALTLSGIALGRGSPAFVGGLVAYAAFATVCVWRLPGAYYRALRFGVDEHGITIQRGILWRSKIALPRIRVQHTDVSQGPLQRRYGVATLKLYTAGSRYTKIELPGLEHDDAIALRDALLARGGDSGV
jgi:membrane protein YdbS with pleckstrin-like domain